MTTKTLFLCGVALLQLQSVLAIPVADHVSTNLRRANITVDPPANPSSIVTEIAEMTEQELQEYLETLKSGVSGILPRAKSVASDVLPRAVPLATRQNTDEALLTFIEGDVLPGNGTAGCTDFSLDGPFTTVHAGMGSSNVRALTVTNYAGNTSTVGNSELIVDAGEFTFTDNERITRFTVGRFDGYAGVRSFEWETTAGNVYSATSTTVKDGGTSVVTEDLNVGSGIIARFTGTYCDTGVMGSFGVDFMDDLDSIAITDIDYSGFTSNTMPAGGGTQMSVGSQILDNRNSTEKQTITLSTTDAITRQTTIVTETHQAIGGKLTVNAGVNIPFLSAAGASAEASWTKTEITSNQEMSNTVTTRAGLFPLVCAAGKYCTGRAFFTQFKMDVDMTATFTATTKTGKSFNWTQSGTYQGADSLAMQFNVTQVDFIS